MGSSRKICCAQQPGRKSGKKLYNKVQKLLGRHLSENVLVIKQGGMGVDNIIDMILGVLDYIHSLKICCAQQSGRKSDPNL